MAVDLSVFKNIRTKADYDRLEREFQARKMQARAQSQDPAVIREWKAFQAMSPDEQQRFLQMKRADKYIDTGDSIKRMNQQGGVAESIDKQLAPNQELDYIGDAAGTKEEATQQVRQAYEPTTEALKAEAVLPAAAKRRGMESQYKMQEQSHAGGVQKGVASHSAAVGVAADKNKLINEYDIRTEREPELIEVKGKAEDDVTVSSELRDQMSQIPGLMEDVAELHKLGQEATYTKKGQMYDAFMQEAFGTTTPGALAASGYSNKVKNVILPRLKATFGAAFSVEEYKALESTLGNEGMTPEQKSMALKNFVGTAINRVQAKQRQLGREVTPIENPLDNIGQGAENPSLYQRGERDFKARKKFTPEQIEEYKRIRGLK